MTIGQVMAMVKDLERRDSITADWHDNTLCVTIQDIGDYDEKGVENFIRVLYYNSNIYNECTPSTLYFDNFSVFIDRASDEEE